LNACAYAYACVLCLRASGVWIEQRDWGKWVCGDGGETREGLALAGPPFDACGLSSGSGKLDMSSSLLAPPAEAESAIMTDASPAKITRWRRDSPPRIPPRISSPSLISREHDEDSGAPLPHPALEARTEIHSAVILVVSPHPKTPLRFHSLSGYPLLIELMS